MAPRKKEGSKKVKKAAAKTVAMKSGKGQEPDAIRGQLELHAKPEDLGGAYSNFAVIKHTKREFITDFVWRMDNMSILVSRVIMSPQQTKAVHRALGQNIQTYEKTNGEIKED